ncbi:MAG: LptA/OstA family protein [Candidatus Cloacimonetes bacterium]|nr:LptA/OstA family protein [Candidatus Cloacimonadota bacterium]
MTLSLNKNTFIKVCVFVIMALCLNLYAAKTESRNYRLINADNLQMNKHMNEYITQLKGNVMFYYGDTQFKADQAELYEQQKTVILKGNVRIKEDSLTFYGDNAYYYRNEEYIKAIGRCVVREDHTDNTYRELKAQKIDFYRERGDLYANDNVLLFEQKDNIYAKSGYAQYNTQTGYGYMIKSPFAWQKAKDDSLSIKAEKIEFFKDNNKMIASFDVISNSKDMHTNSDFLVYYMNEGKAVYLGKPKIYSDFGDAASETVTVYFEDNKISHAELQDSCKVVFAEEKGKEKKNWIIGDKLTVNWENDKLVSFKAVDNVSSYIWQDQKKKQKPMNNHAKAEELEIYFDEEQNIEVIKLKTQVKGKYAFKRK